MPKKYHLDLYENSIDSLNVGMKFYNESLEDESMYKFSIIIISNFMELLLKHMIELQNPLLCFEKPYSTNLNKERSITWKQALQILSNLNVVIEKELIIIIEKLSNLRNKIIHYKFEYDTSEIRAVLVLVIDGLRKLYKTYSKHDFINDVSNDTKKILQTIESEYQVELHLAQANAKEEAEENGTYCDDCNFCGESETVVMREQNEIYCYFCEETDHETECCRCTESYKISEMQYLGETEDGDDLYLCEYCSDLLNSDD